MKIIWNNFIPVKGFKAINLFGVLFARCNAVISETTLRHEHIHTMQMREMLYVPFYLWYGIEYVIKFIGWRFEKKNPCYPDYNWEIKLLGSSKKHLNQFKYYQP